MATIQTVAVGVPRGTQFNARAMSTGTLKAGSSTVKVQYIKQSPAVEYYDGNSWVTSDPGPLSMTEDANVPGVYEHTVTYDAAGVDYIVRCWDAADSDVQQLVGRVHGVQPQEADGVWRVHITLRNTGPGGAPVPDVTVSLKNASGQEVARDTTNANGEANGLAVAGAGTYAVELAKAAWTFADETLVVSGSDPSPRTAEYYGSAFDAGSPAGPEMCRVYDWIKDVEGAVPVAGRQINVELVDSPAAGPPVYYDDENSQAKTDANGYFYVDLVRSSNMGSARLRIYSANDNGPPDGAIDRTIRVPDQASAALSTIADALPA